MLFFIGLALLSQSTVEDSSISQSQVQYSIFVDSADNLTSILVVNSASKFEHQQQSPTWQFSALTFAFIPSLSANIYLLTEPINITWFLQPQKTSNRLSGWKDSNLQYTIKDAFI